ncbi:hypothetical protein C8J56DRAFT_538752 [Mycena floridula]|nr:hypothetical protein C8J56DRAFT_538752 [Mycena floridula]
MHLSIQFVATFFLASTLAWPIPVLISPRAGAEVQSIADLFKTVSGEARKSCQHLLPTKPPDRRDIESVRKLHDALVECLIAFEIKHGPKPSSTPARQPTRVVTLDTPLVPLTAEQREQERLESKAALEAKRKKAEEQAKQIAAMWAKKAKEGAAARLAQQGGASQTAGPSQLQPSSLKRKQSADDSAGPLAKRPRQGIESHG